MYKPWLNNIDLNKRILEIGPLATPNIKKEQGKNVFYADIRSTEGVKELFINDPYVNLFEKVVGIDYVINTAGYYECLKDVDKFDYIVATHVIEHIPQLIFFFQDIAKILNPKGKVCLTIPDKRYCFDHFRCPTSFAECYDVYTRGINNLPFRVLDCIASRTINDSAFWWKEPCNFEHIPKSKENYDSAKKEFMEALNGKYIDVHFSVFTPETFLLLIYNMIYYNLFPFRLVEFYGTETDCFEFNCVLELAPNILIENSIENKQEKENLIRLLAENSDLRDFLITIENLNEKLKKTKSDLQRSNYDLESILSSKSWKITAPLRRMRAIYNKLTSHQINSPKQN